MQSGVRVGIVLDVDPQFSAGEEIPQIGCSTVRNGELTDVHATTILISQVVQRCGVRWCQNVTSPHALYCSRWWIFGVVFQMKKYSLVRTCVGCIAS